MARGTLDVLNGEHPDRRFDEIIAHNARLEVRDTLEILGKFAHGAVQESLNSLAVLEYSAGQLAVGGGAHPMVRYVSSN
jgi:hypothetical protein